MIDVNWKPGNFFHREFDGAPYYGVVLSSCKECGKTHVAIIPWDFDIDAAPPCDFVEFHSDIRGIQGLESSNSREFIIPVREVDLPKRIALCLGIFSSGWYYKGHSCDSASVEHEKVGE